jgi:hypothetical protein
MPEQKLLPAPKPEIKIETVRFIFPKSHELALYALATLQSFVDNYYKVAERINLWKAFPEQRKELLVRVHCDQRFYMTFGHSFPDCATYELPFMPSPDSDEFCIVLHENVLQKFDLQPSYSIQWLMGMLAGTQPRMLPKIVSPLTLSSDYPIIYSRFGINMPNAMRIDDKFLMQPQLGESAMRVLCAASIIIAPQSFVTVLGVAIGKPVVETTRLASQRSMLGAPNYVQVSALNLEAFFYNSLERGIEWLRQKISLPSGVSNVPGPFPNSPPRSESPRQPVNCA